MFSHDGFFSKFSSKSSFLAGIGLTLAIFFVVGFFVLLGIVLKDRKKEVVVNPTPTNTAPGQTAPANITVAPVTDKDWIRGNKNAKISVVEYSDLECPFCKTFHPTMQRLLQEYPNDVNWVWRHFPLVSLHSKASKEAEASECAGELGGQDKFWAYIDKVFAVTPSNNGLDLAQLPKLAKEIGLDEAKFTSCLDSGKYNAKIQEAVNAAVAAGGEGTPYSVILVGDQKVPVSGAVPYEQFKSFVDSELEKS